MLAKGSLHLILLPLAAALLSLILLFTVLLPLAIFLFILFLALAALTANFFRDPEREVGKGIVSPADGTVRSAERTGGATYFSIFMNIHDVHVNRAPWPGRVIEVVRMPGKHRPAYRKDADRNARARITLDTSLGKMTVTLMAGIFARRILPYVKAGQELDKGERISIIRFGSRVDLLVPTGRLGIRVKPGDHVLAGVTTLAEPRKERANGGAGRKGKEKGTGGGDREGSGGGG
jgi:phosphatidylserine decarboxylase